MKKSGFTLIELLVVIGIIAMLVSIAIPNFLSARQRAVDSRKKSEMAQLKNALRIYYNDYNKYPASYNGGGKLNSIKGCGVNGTSNCDRSVCTAVDFAAGGAGCDTVYMKTFPINLGSGTFPVYYYQSGAVLGDDFCLSTKLDNLSDPDIATSKARCTTSCTIGSNNNCNTAQSYCVCGD